MYVSLRADAAVCAVSRPFIISQPTTGTVDGDEICSSPYGSSPDGKVWSGRTTKYQGKDCASVTGYLALLSLCHCPDRYCCRFHQKDKTKQSTHDSTIHTTEFCRSHLSNNTLLLCPLIPSKAHTPAYYIQQNFAGAI